MGKAIDLTGQKIGRLTLLQRKRDKNRTYYYCKCDCGSELWVRADSLNGNTLSCGCYNKDNNFYKVKDIKNKIFGRLIAIEPTDKRDKFNNSVIWKCRCNCGNIHYVAEYLLTQLRVRSCGCLGLENSKENIQKAIDVYVKNNIVEGTNIEIISRDTIQANNTSGVPGVSWDSSRNKWMAQIQFKGIHYNLGRYDNKDDAIKIRKQAEKKMFGEFLEWYNERKKEGERNETK